MTQRPASPRLRLLRRALLFQLKLLADGLRDFVLMPVSLAAALLGLVRSDQDPGREFAVVLAWGRRSEQWINLFGQHDPIHEAGDAGSIDRLVDRAEQVVRDQVRKGGVSASAGQAIVRALERLHERTAAAQQDEGGGASPPGDAGRPQ